MSLSNFSLELSSLPPKTKFHWGEKKDKLIYYVEIHKKKKKNWHNISINFLPKRFAPTFTWVWRHLGFGIAPDEKTGRTLSVSNKLITKVLINIKYI